MKKIVLPSVILTVLLTFAIGFAGMEMDHSKMDHSKMDHSKMEEPKESIVEKEQGDYMFKFDFIDLKERMPDMDTGGKTHHLMVYVTDKSGNAVMGAKVKFKLFAPSKKESETMAMAMGKGYGADVELSEKGKHGIATMIKIGDKKELVKIHFEVK